ncbi:MAG: hypothetical protein QM781_13080 [Chitinophagaceae bacterium]
MEMTGWELFDTDPMTGTNGGIVGGWERGRVQFELSNHLGNSLSRQRRDTGDDQRCTNRGG